MLQKITSNYGVRTKLEAYTAEAEEMIEKYGWQKMTIAPYGHSEPLMRYIKMFHDYDRCTVGSRETLISIWNGLVDVLNAWEQSEKEKTSRVRLLNGKHKGEERMLAPWMAELLIDEGSAEAI